MVWMVGCGDCGAVGGRLHMEGRWVGDGGAGTGGAGGEWES
jgi:hypothetical protein